MKLEEIKSVEVDEAKMVPVPRDGVRVAMPLGREIDPITGLLDRAFWGDGDGLVYSTVKPRCDAHMGAVEC